MASPRRNARTVVLTTSLLTTLAMPLAAEATPPEHAAAHGHTSVQGTSGRPDDATPPPHAAAKGHSPRHQDRGRTTASATSQGPSTADDTSPGQSQGRARGHEHAPGQAKKDRARAPQAATDAATPRGKAKGASPAAGPDEPATTPPPARRPEPVIIAPAPGSGVEAGAPVVPALPQSPPTQATAPAQPDAPATPGRRVWRLDIDGPFADLLEDVRTTINRVVPQDLGPVREPLVRLVPVLLAILGAFLALQRGIGRGLGHVPMVASSALYDPPRRD